ncbi:branched-chain amino acid ABC transporter permease [Loktanella sp. M215]|uniref:branched-chain amino acid ABC transporter permease n=1 Tax=Loktanella sp. M215 TaxID=2675431 RepID=UPI001F4811BB|nr:branched-chain amino acid ABC transporter permease [Loktanella sp. M215]
MSSTEHPLSRSTSATPRAVTFELVAGALCLVLAIALPAYASVYVLYMASLVAINAIATVGLNVTVGYTGLLSIGHSAFIGVGAYAAGLSMLHLGTPLFVNVVIGAVAAFSVGLIFGIPSLRIKGVYLAIATLAAQYSLYFLFQQWTSVTGGDRGISLPGTDLFGMGDTGFYYGVLLVALVLFVGARNLFRTRIGRSFIAVRERDYAAQVLGINVVRTKLLAFGIGAAFAGVSGALTAHFLRLVNPDQFTLTVSVFFLAAVVVGGRASILGSILGAAFMTLLPEVLREILSALPIQGQANVAGLLSPLREIIFGLLIIGFLMFEPRGLKGILDRLLGRRDSVAESEAE